MPVDGPETSPFSLLPLDLLHLICIPILDFPPAIATANLHSLSLASRAWSLAAQPALFHSPYLSSDPLDRVEPRTYARLKSFLEAVQGRPDLAAAVRDFDAGKYTARCTTEAEVDRRLVSRLSIKLIQVCSNLRTLSLPFVTQADKYDLVVALRKLSSLEVVTIGEGAAISDPWVINVDIAIKDQWGTAVWTRDDMVTFANHWPRLRKVVLQVKLKGLTPDAVAPIPWQLEGFELALLKHGKVSFDYLDRLLSNTHSSLRRLVLTEHQLDPDDLLHVFEAYGATLTALETTTANIYAPNKSLFSTIASSCPSLRFLRLGTPVYALSSCLLHLSELHHLSDLALDHILLQRLEGPTSVLAAELRRFPRLRRLSLTPGYHGDPTDDLEQFQQFQLRLHALKSVLKHEVEVIVRPPFC
ncbi:hypothetical protein JCM11641_004900 [Rhodosporidiobolus odoratus]